MHILLVNNIYPPIMAGGAELIVAWLAEALAADGHRVTVASTCARGTEAAEWRNGVEVLRFFPRNLYWHFTRGQRSRMEKALWHLRDAWNSDAGARIGRIIDARRIDVVHTHLLDGMSAAVWHAARQRGIPVLHTAHDYHLICPRALLVDRGGHTCTRPSAACQIYRKWHLRTARQVDLFVGPSRFIVDAHLAAGLAARRSAVLRNGIPLPGDAAEIRAARRPERVARLLMLSRLTQEKGIETIFAALDLLPEDVKLHLTIAGTGPLEAMVRARARRDPRLHFAGYASGDAKRALLRESDYLLLPSQWFENAPVTIIEAAAYGLGLVGSRIGGIPELVREGETGLLVEPGNPAAWADMLAALAEGRRGLPNLAAASWALAQEYGVGRMMQAYAEEYARLAADRLLAAA